MEAQTNEVNYVEALRQRQAQWHTLVKELAEVFSRNRVKISEMAALYSAAQAELVAGNAEALTGDSQSEGTNLTNRDVRKILEKQLQLLSEYSRKEPYHVPAIVELSEAMLAIGHFLITCDLR